MPEILINDFYYLGILLNTGSSRPVPEDQPPPEGWRRNDKLRKEKYEKIFFDFTRHFFNEPRSFRSNK